MMEYEPNTIASEIASALLNANAIKLNKNKPFTWASGWKSPIYCDNRLTLSYPDIRSQITKALVNEIRTNFKSAEVIAGVATAGIPQAALVASALKLPMIYVRDKAKGHGMENLIEGKLDAGQKVVVIEDLISTGGSSLKAVKALRDNGAQVIGMAAVFTYGFANAAMNFAEAQVPLVTLSNYAALLTEAVSQNIISADDLPFLQKWQESPQDWG